jgi:uncharacterized protein YbaR (Trm112 family)
MHTYLIDMLACPACHGELEWRVVEQEEDRIEAAETSCQMCGATYSVRDGIGLFLTPDLPRNDLWEQVDSRLIQYLRENPEIERQLMDVPLDTLAPADRFFRALVLEARGDYVEAHTTEKLANEGIYTPEYMACWKCQMDTVIQQLSTTDGPIVDLASGRCYLVEELAQRLQRPVIVTDFSPGVLRRARRWLESVGLYDRVSLLAFDARRTPFKDGAVETMTTNVGLPNIEETGSLLKELRRIVAGPFLAISHFYPEEDGANAEVIREAGLEASLYRRTLLGHYAQAGWEVELKTPCVGEARPTPVGSVIEGVGIDRLPVADTHLEWCVLLGI